MNAQPDSSTAYLEVIFDKRNKSYGAYSLRRSYPDRLNLAVLISISFVALIFITPLILSKTARESILTIACGSCDEAIIFDDWTKRIEPLIAPPKSRNDIQPRRNDNQNFTPLVVTHDIDSVINDDPDPADNPDLLAGGTGTGTDPLDTGTGTGTGDDPNSNPDIEKEPDTEDYVNLDEYPEFTGGMAAYYKYMQKNIVYPDLAKEYNAEGTVYLEVVIDKDGSIKTARVLKDIGFGCGAEAKRVVEGMPKWKPGKMKGKSVPVRMTLRVKFSLH